MGFIFFSNRWHREWDWFLNHQLPSCWGFIPSHQYLCCNLSRICQRARGWLKAVWSLHSLDNIVTNSRYVLLNPNKNGKHVWYVNNIYIYIYFPIYLYTYGPWDYTWDAHYIKILCAHIQNMHQASMKQTHCPHLNCDLLPRLDATVDQQITEWCLPENRHDFFISPNLIHMLAGEGVCKLFWL